MFQIIHGRDINNYLIHCSDQPITHKTQHTQGHLHCLTGSVVGHISTAPGFRLGYVGRVFHISLCLITFGGRSAHLVYIVHKSGRKTAASTFFTHKQSLAYN